MEGELRGEPLILPARYNRVLTRINPVTRLHPLLMHDCLGMVQGGVSAVLDEHAQDIAQY